MDADGIVLAHSQSPVSWRGHLEPPPHVQKTRIKQAQAYISKKLKQRSKADASREIEQELRKVQGELANVSDAIAQIGHSRTLQEKLVDLEARERELNGSLERERKTVARDPSMALSTALTVLKPVMLKPEGEYLKGNISFDGSSAIFQTNSAPKKGAEIGLVAGAGFEPATFGL